MQNMIALSSKPLTNYLHDHLQPCATVGTEPIRSGPSFALGLLVNRGVCLGDEFPDTAYSLRSAPASGSVCNLALGRCLPQRESIQDKTIPYKAIAARKKSRTRTV
jgi:hypothetical protein